MFRNVFCISVRCPILKWSNLLMRNSSTLLIAEHSDNQLAPSTLNSVTAVQKLGHSVTCALIGDNCKSAAEELSKVNGVSKVLKIESPSLEGSLAESVVGAIVACQEKLKASHIAFGDTSFGKNVMPRLAAKLDVAPITAVIDVVDDSTFQRTIYAGNAVQTIKSLESVKVFSIRGTAFPAAQTGGGGASVEDFPASGENKLTKFIGAEIHKSDRPQLTTANVVIAGGRGMGSAENFKIVYELADKLKGAVGASRAAVDAGYVSNDLQVGQTGKVVAPDLYIAVGISGAIQHLAGMKDSKIIVAINKDEEAPIFQVADYGLVQDLFTAVPEMNKLL